MVVALVGALGWVYAVASPLVAPATDAASLRADHEEWQWIGDPRLLPADALELVGEVTPRAAQRATVFVNFDGAELVAGNDDARANSTAITELAGSFPDYGSGSGRAAVLQAVERDFDLYDVVLVDHRPSSGNYTMAMVGPVDSGSTLGIALLDCDDRFPNNVVFAFHGEGDGYTAASQANTISQELAHSFGLEHVDQSGDVMFPMSTGGDPAFLDQCSGIVPAPEITCPAQHAVHCEPGGQNSHRELLSRFGPRTPDDEDPAVRIVDPEHEDELEVGADFDIVASAVDERAIANVVLFVDEGNVGGRTEAPYTWNVQDMPMGVFDMYVVAIDDAGNMSRSETVTIYVGVESPRRDDERGCRLGAASPGRAWLGLLLAIGLRRRRR
ncbi:MAG: Ig-like domain-containing protein [Deltaproteobacteria bacterium]|nr:Ig-like domain-containing protein [Nannocystaceae bacterium]